MFRYKNRYEEYHTFIVGTARDAFKRAYSELRGNSRFEYPNEFVHYDMPELGITLACFTIPEDQSDDEKIHRTRCIERTVF